MSMTMTTISIFLLLVSISTSVSPSASQPLEPPQHLLRRSRGLCVSTLCRDDGDLICEYLCAVIGDREGLEENKNKNTKEYNKENKIKTKAAR